MLIIILWFIISYKIIIKLLWTKYKIMLNQANKNKKQVRSYRRSLMCVISILCVLINTEIFALMSLCYPISPIYIVTFPVCTYHTLYSNKIYAYMHTQQQCWKLCAYILASCSAIFIIILYIILYTVVGQLSCWWWGRSLLLVLTGSGQW